MTDKELDELEARLCRVTEDRETPPSFYLLARLFKDAANALSTMRKEKAELRDALWNLLLDDAVCTLEDAARSDPYDTKRAKDLSELFKDARTALKGKETP